MDDEVVIGDETMWDSPFVSLRRKDGLGPGGLPTQGVIVSPDASGYRVWFVNAHVDSADLAAILLGETPAGAKFEDYESAAAIVAAGWEVD